MSYVRCQRVRVIIFVSLFSAFHAMVSFYCRLRLCLYTLRQVSFTSRNAGHAVATGVEMSHCRRVPWVGEFICISIR